jgi:hypothetical protein
MGPSSGPYASYRKHCTIFRDTLMSSYLGPRCRYPGCDNFIFFDRRVNELREWCSDEHMQCESFSTKIAELSYLFSVLRLCMAWRSPAKAVESGLGAMAISIAVAIVAYFRQASHHRIGHMRLAGLHRKRKLGWRLTRCH